MTQLSRPLGRGLGRSGGRRLCLSIACLGAFGLGLSVAPARAEGPVFIDDLAYDPIRHSVVLTISAPVTISTRSLSAPARLVIDIPGANLVSKNRELEINDALFSRVRISQFKLVPATVRVVIVAATAIEPMIAVQQTSRQLFITLAPARPHEEPSISDRPPPTPIPTPARSTWSSSTPTPRRTPGFRRPISTPLPPKPTAMPSPGSRRSGESDYETLPTIP